MQKGMITIEWNPTGFQVIPLLPSGCKFNGTYDQNEILGPFSEWRSELAGAESRRLIVHLTTPDHIERHSTFLAKIKKPNPSHRSPDRYCP
jgi:hypothetical protein